MVIRHRSWMGRLGSGGVLVGLGALPSIVFGAACSARAESMDAVEPSEARTEAGDPRLRGELEMYIATFDDGRTETTYYLRRGDDKVRLDVTGDLDLTPGTAVQIEGAETLGSIHVDRIVPVGIGSAPSPTLSPTGSPKGEFGEAIALQIDAGAKASRKMAVVLVDTGGGMGSLTAATVGQSFFTGPKSVNAYYRENSYGIQGLDGQVLGPIAYTMNDCDTDGMAKAIKAQITDPYDQYAYVFPRSSACSWGGLASVGTPTKPSKDTWYNGSVSCVVAVQEPGHNYGMQHSSSMTCGAATFADDLSACTHSEYGDECCIP